MKSNLHTKRMRSKLLGDILTTAFIGIMLLIIYLPLLVLMVYSFTNTATMGQWGGFSFKLYIKLFQHERIMTALANTLIIAAVSSLIATLLGTVSAVGIYHLKRVPKSIVNGMSQITVVNSEIVTAIALMLLFIVLRKINLPIPRGFATLIISHTVITIPYVILSVTPRLTQLNPNLYEAGLDLGCSPLNSLFRVILPQLIPGMISGFVMAFTLSLDDFVVTSFNNGSVETISTLIYNSIKKVMPPELRALSTLMLVAVGIVLLVVNLSAKKKAINNLKGK